jgi:hypothetical protein
MIIDLADLAQLCLQAPHWRHHSACDRLDEHALVYDIANLATAWSLGKI